MARQKDEFKERQDKLAVKKVFDLDGAKVTVNIALDPDLAFDTTKDFDDIEDALNGLLARLRRRVFDARPMVRDHWLKERDLEAGERETEPART